MGIGQWMDKDTALTKHFFLCAHGKKMHLISRVGQSYTRPMEDSPVIRGMSIANLTYSLHGYSG
jgi:hypothetical protein